MITAAEILRDFYVARGAVPLHIETMQAVNHDGICVAAIACKMGARGRGYFVLGYNVLRAINKNQMINVMAAGIRSASDCALREWLIDHETQQGWPPRECLHEETSA